jgi:dienelactone hydrolase
MRRRTEEGRVRGRGRAGLLAAVAVVTASVWATPAHATVASTLYGATACDATTGTPGTVDPHTPHTGFSYFFCDDGVPSTGGVVPNTTGASAITVPAKYGNGGAGDTNSFSGLPHKAANAATMPGADASGQIALDVDVSVPASAAPAGGYPMVVMMHGCCSGNKTSWESNGADGFDKSGESWHYNNAWFAARGYVVVNYTARGFVNSSVHGSTGETQLDSRSFEINDFQSLACQIDANAGNFGTTVGHPVSIDPTKVVVTGGSYGGGFSWLAATDPRWTCTADTGTSDAMSLAAAAPKYGWTDLSYTLVPNGFHSEDPSRLPATNGCDTGPLTLTGATCPPGTGAPFGVPKSSILNVLYTTGTNPGGNHTTFPAEITDGFACLGLTGTYPFTPACTTTLSSTLPVYLRERSAYYQNRYFNDITGTPADAVPIYNAATFTDPLFPAYEDRRMANRLLAVDPSYPIKQFYGDYQHFTQNKAKEWGDECDADHHVCAVADYPVVGGHADVNNDPTNLVRTGITTRLNKFIDHFAQPAGGYTASGGYTQQPSDTTPDVTADLSVCPDNAASLGVANDEPGPAQGPTSTFEQLAPHTLTANLTGSQTTTSTVPGVNTHAAHADPIYNFLFNGGACPKETSVAGAGVATYTSPPLPSTATMVGATKVTVNYALTAPPGDAGAQFNVRLYDLAPGGTALMVDRGTRRLSVAEQSGSQVTFELDGNGWRFPAGDSLRVEIAQDDNPSIKSSSVASSAALSGTTLQIPIEESGFTVPTPSGPTPTPTDTGSTTPTTPSSTTPPSTPRRHRCKKHKRSKKSASSAKKRCKKKRK